MEEKKKKLYRDKKINMFVTYTIRLILIFLFIWGIIFNDYSQIFLITITLVLTYYPNILEKRYGLYLPNRLQIVITLFIFASQVLGEMQGFYEKFPWWDTMLHFTSGIILGIVGFLFVYLLNEKGDANVNLSPMFVIIFAYCFALTMGVFWEIYEFSADRLLGFNMQKFRELNQDGLVDTMNDLIIDSIGAAISCFIGWLYIKKEQDTLFNNYFDKWFKSERKRKK